MYRGISALFVDKLLQVLMELSLTLGTWRGCSAAREREDTGTNVTRGTSQ